MVELQKDPITRSDFLGLGFVGAVMGAILTIPPVAFVLGPIINVDVLGQSDVPDDWFEVGPVSDVPEGEPLVFEVEFPVHQTYGIPDVQEESGVSDEEFTVPNAVWVSWRDGERPPELDEAEGNLTPEQISALTEQINVMSNSCAHLGCPVRWVTTEGVGEFLCPCHGGIYGINGEYLAGPPPRGLYNYTFEIRENGRLYIRHEFDGPGRPYVV